MSFIPMSPGSEDKAGAEDEVVNVVGGRGSPRKVKRGGMNYFLPGKIDTGYLAGAAVTGLV